MPTLLAAIKIIAYEKQLYVWVVVSQFIDKFGSERSASMNVADNSNECWYSNGRGVGDDDIVIYLAKSLKIFPSMGARSFKSLQF